MQKYDNNHSMPSSECIVVINLKRKQKTINGKIGKCTVLEAKARETSRDGKYRKHHTL